MKYRLHGINTKAVLAAIGVWDPLTYNHLNLIEFLTRRARYLNCHTCIILLHPKPIYFLQNQPKQIYFSDITFVIYKILGLGVNCVLEVEFESKSDIYKNATHFIPAILKFICLKELYLGATQSLGQGQNGNQETIIKLAAKFNFKYKIIAKSIFKFKAKRINENQKLLQLLNGGFIFNKRITPFHPTHYIFNKVKIYLPYKSGDYMIGLKTTMEIRITKTVMVKLKNNILELDTAFKDKYHWLVIVRGPP